MRRVLKRSLALLLAMLMTLSALSVMTGAQEYDDLSNGENDDSSRIASEPDSESLLSGETSGDDAALDGVSTYASAAVDAETLTTETSRNFGDQEYGSSRLFHSSVMNSHMEELENGYMRVEYIDDVIVIEYYDDDFTLTSKKYLAMELPLFGGFYAGSDAYYLVFGQENLDEDNSVEVIRVVKYSKDWERLDQASLFGANTYIPFDAGNCRMAESNGYLYIRTCHEMYAIAGVNHQASMMLRVRESDMEIDYTQHLIGNETSGYVSHSFNQFILVDDEDNVIALDHGDGNCRGLVLFKYDKKAGSDSFSSANTNTMVFPVMGSTENYTGASVGGLEYSSTSYLAAGSSVTQDDNWESNKTRNVFVTVTSRDDVSENGTTVKWITNYEEGTSYSASTPQLVKLSDDSFLLLWSTIRNSYATDLYYVYLDGQGNMTSEIKTTPGVLSDCKPIVNSNGSVIWYVTGTLYHSSSPVFYEIDTNGDLTIHSCSGLLYTIEDGEVTIIGYLEGRLPEDLVIPETIEGCPVTSIGQSSFEYCDELKSLTIDGSGATYMGIDAFRGCTGLETVTLGSRVTTIDNLVFMECTDLKSAYIAGSGDTEIGRNAFNGCTSLEKVAIGTGVSYLSTDVFNNCPNLTDIIYEGTLRHWFSIANSVWGANITDSTGRTYTNCGASGSYSVWGLVTDGTLVFSGTGTIHVYGIGYAPWYDLRENVTSVIIEDGITDIAQWMFYDMLNIQSVEISDTVTKIGQSAFCNCSSLKNIIIPDSVTSISNYAFENCTSLESIAIPDGVGSLGIYVFDGCTSLKTVTIGSGISSVNSTAFRGCENLTDIYFDGSFEQWVSAAGSTFGAKLHDNEGNTYIGCGTCGTDLIWGLETDGTLMIFGDGEMGSTTLGYAPWYSLREDVKKVVIEDGVTTIGQSAFYNLINLQSVEIPDTVTRIGQSGFSGCSSLKDIEIPASVTYISNYAFEDCTSLESIVIPNDVTYIGYSAFEGCTGLKSVVIQAGVDTIDSRAFYGCSALNTITFKGNAPSTIGSNCFYGVTATALYPCSDTTWTSSVMKSYGGTITWSAEDHTWGNITWTWSSDHSSATASRTCSACRATETEKAAVTSVTTNPTCTNSGKTVYTGTVVFDGVTYKDEVTVTLAATGHSWGKADWTWNSDLSSATVSRTCSVCGVTEQAVATVTVTTTEPTCTEPGMKIYTAKATLDGTELTDTIREVMSSALGHIWGEPVWTWSENHSSASVSRTCQRSGCGTTETVQATVTSQVISEPTEEKDGEILYTASATFSDGTKVSDSVSAVMPFTNKEALDEEIGKAEAEEKYKDDYTAASWADFQTALDAAKSVLNDVTATQENVDQALANLERAYENLVLAPIPEYLQGFNELNGNWYYFVNGNIAYGMNDVLEGTVKGITGWWYIVNGQVQLNYTGVCNYSNAYGWWYVKNGMVDFSKTSIEQNNYGWWRVVGGKVDFSCNSVEQNDYGWWYVLGGQVQFGYTGVANYANAYGWWYIKGGQVDFSKTSIEPNNYGWWRVVGGKVDFGCNSVEQNDYGWWYVVGGQVQFGYTGVANYANAYGWWYIKGGQVDFSRTSVEQNNFGWWRVENGKVNFSFTGWATNNYGRWYCVNGKVDFSRS